MGTKEERNFWRRKKRESLFLLQKFQGGGMRRGKILLEWWRGREKFLLLYQRGKILLGRWRGREKFLFLHQGGKVQIEEEIFQKKNFLPLLKGGGQKGEGVLQGKSFLNLLGGRVTSLRGSVAQSEGGGGRGSEES